MQTVIDWIPGAPVCPEKDSEWFGMTDAGDIFSAKYGFKLFDTVLYTNAQQTYSSKEFAYHAPYHPAHTKADSGSATRKALSAIKAWAKEQAESNVNWEGEADGTRSVDYQGLMMHLDSLESGKNAEGQA